MPEEFSKFAIFTSYGEGLALVDHLQSEGCEVLVGMVDDLADVGEKTEKPEAKALRWQQHDGMYQKEDAWKLLERMSAFEDKDEWALIFDFNNLWKFADQARKYGFKTGLFPMRLDRKLEDDRDFAKEFVQKYYPKLKVAETQEFKSVEDALQFLNESDEFWALKGNDQAATTVVPRTKILEHAKSDITDALQANRQAYESKGFLFERQIRDGVEVCPQCFDEETEVLTEGGWKSHKQISVGEKVLSLNPQTKELEYKKIIGYFSGKYGGEMVSIDTPNFNALVTPNHNFYLTTAWGIDKFRIADDLKEGDSIYRTGHFNGSLVEEEVIPEYIENKVRFFGKNNSKRKQDIRKEIRIPINDWMAFLGLFLSEGSFHERQKGKVMGVKISQNKNNGSWLAMRDIIESLPFNFSVTERGDFIISNVQLANHLCEMDGKRSWEKYIPEKYKNLNSEALRSFLNAFRLGDGSKHAFTLFTSSKRLVDDLQEIAIKSGYTPIARPNGHKPGDVSVKKDGSLITTKHQVWTISICEERTKKTITKKNVSRKRFNGVIWDIEVEDNHTLVVRRNGKPFVSGNCIFMDGKRVASCIDLEDKAFSDTNSAELEGCANNIIVSTPLDCELNEWCFPEAVDLLAKKHTGLFYIDANIIIKDGEAYFLEFCSGRLGYDAIFAECDMSDGVAQYFNTLFRGETPYQRKYGAGTRGFMTKRDEDGTLKEGLSFQTDDKEHIWTFGVRKDGSKLLNTKGSFGDPVHGIDLAAFTESSDDSTYALEKLQSVVDGASFNGLHARRDTHLLLRRLDGLESLLEPKQK